MIKLNLFSSEINTFLKSNSKIENKHLSLIARWNSENLDMQVDIDSKKGALFLFVMAALYNYGGGGPGRNTELLKLYPILNKDNFTKISAFHKLNIVRRSQILAANKFIDNLFKKYKSLTKYWEQTKKKYKGNVELASIHFLKELLKIKFYSNRKNKNEHRIYQHLFTSKAFFVSRELHANNVWPDFALKYCFVPDIKMVQNKIEGKFETKWIHLFLLSEFLHNELSTHNQKTFYDWPLLPIYTK